MLRICWQEVSAMIHTVLPGQYVPLKETIRGFRMIIDGECDDIPESCFLFAGTIDEVFKKAGKAGTV